MSNRKLIEFAAKYEKNIANLDEGRGSYFWQMKKETEFFLESVDNLAKIKKQPNEKLSYLRDYNFSIIFAEDGTLIQTDEAKRNFQALNFLLFYSTKRYGEEFVFTELLPKSIVHIKQSKLNPINWLKWIFNKVVWSEIKANPLLTQDENFCRAVEDFKTLSEESSGINIFRDKKLFQALDSIIKRMAGEYKYFNELNNSDKVAIATATSLASAIEKQNNLSSPPTLNTATTPPLPPPLPTSTLDTTATPPTSALDRTTTPPTSALDTTTTPPTSALDTTTTPPTSALDTTTTPPSPPPSRPFSIQDLKDAKAKLKPGNTQSNSKATRHITDNTNNENELRDKLVDRRSFIRYSSSESEDGENCGAESVNINRNEKKRDSLSDTDSDSGHLSVLDDDIVQNPESGADSDSSALSNSDIENSFSNLTSIKRANSPNTLFPMYQGSKVDNNNRPEATHNTSIHVR